MYPSLPFGPISMPTGPFLTLLAFWVGLEVASRYGRRLGLHSDAVWNAGLVAILAGLIVARLWNVVQFWYVYAEQPLLIFSLRPSGFALWPGLIAALVGGYAYLIARALDPVKMAAAFAVGGLAAAGILNLSQYLTGATLGVLTDSRLALPYYGEPRHPVALYRMVGMVLALVAVLAWSDPRRPARTLWLAGLGFCLVHLIADGFVANGALVGEFRTSQVLAFVGALIFSLLLARDVNVRRVDSAPAIPDKIGNVRSQAPAAVEEESSTP